MVVCTAVGYLVVQLLAYGYGIVGLVASSWCFWLCVIYCCVLLGVGLCGGGRFALAVALLAGV